MTTAASQKKSLFYCMYILSMLLFGTNGVIVSHISIQSSQIVLFRTLIGGFLLTAFVFLRGGFDRVSIRAELPFLLGGGVALGLNWVALFAAFRMLNVSLATLIYYAGPMLVLVFSPVLFHEKLNGIKIIAVIVVAAGLVLISGSIAATGLSLVGLLVAAASALFYGSLIVFNKKIIKTGGLQTAAVELDIAFVVVLIYTLFTAGIPHPQAGDIPYLLLIGLVNTGLAYFLYFTGMQKLPAQSVALISYVDPVSTLAFSAALLHEKLSVFQLIGAVMILGGAIMGERKKKEESPFLPD